VLREFAANKLLHIPFFSDTVSRRISDIAEDLNEHFVEKIRNKPFAVQINKATHSAEDYHIITYVGYVDEKK
jgi:hypothetical protein